MRFLFAAILIFSSSQFYTRAADESSWPPITSQSRPWAFWWWMGSAVDKTNLTKELQRYHDAGLGGVHIIPIYGASGWESNYVDYLSPKWMDLMGYSVSEANRLGMGVDMTLGTGWCFGGPTVSDKDANASVVFAVRTFDLATGSKLPEKFNRDSTQVLMAFSSNAAPVDLTKNISFDGSVDWTVPAGAWKVYAISQKPSGQKVKRPAPGGEGWMLNPLYPQALRDWLPWFDAAFKDYHGPKPRAVYQDSYEYRTDWSPDFFAQFEKLRGYKLQDELPALFSENDDEHAARVKFDYRQTVSEVMSDESEPLWISWAHKNGFTTRYQAHGTPGNWLDLYADADTPETEMFHNDRSILVSKFASSAAHVSGHQLTSAETGTWLVEHFTETLGGLKYLADDMFLAGVNHIFYHGLCYSPDEAGWPGWHFYASTEMNPRNSIWHDAPTLNNYIARVQSVLQSGKPDNDILLYWPVADFWSDPKGLIQPMSVSKTEWFENQSIGKTAHKLWNRGYAFDYVSDKQLLNAKAVNGTIRTPGGDYKVIIVPECKYIPLETFQQLLALAKDGATIIFESQLPSDIAGFGNLKKRRAEFQDAAKTIQSDSESSGVKLKILGKGRIGVGDCETALNAFGIKRETMVDTGLSFIRRSINNDPRPSGDLDYFIANRGDKNVDAWIPLRGPARSALMLNPLTGNSGVAAVQQVGDETRVHLQLAPGGSVILRTFAQKDAEGPTSTYWKTNGAPVGISGTWNVKFISGGPTPPADSQIANLTSWTTFADTNAQAFGGTAKYEITFNAPDSAAKNYFIDLGDVRQSARVELNGKSYGTLITPPFRVAVDNLKPSGNKLAVEVTSVDANRLRDLDRRGVKWKTFHDINFVNVDYRPFNAANWPLTDCGLLGPVTLAPIAVK